MQDDGQIRDRILDATAECLAEDGFADTRLLSAIARRARLSRPTLYKHGGTLEEIKNALLQRETSRFVAFVRGRVEQASWTTEDVVDALVDVVVRARRHPLLRAAVAATPGLVLPWFTTRADVVVAMVTAQLAPVLEARIAAGEVPPLDVELLVDMLTRIVLSLVFTSGRVDADDPDALRGYLRGVAVLAAGLGEVPSRITPRA
jgi:AcrR family transcriptional regulator